MAAAPACHWVIVLCCLATTLGKQDKQVLSPPTFTTKLQTEIAYKTGEQQTLRCEAKADPAPTYEWKKDGVPLDYEALDIKKRPGSGTIVIEEPLSRHSGIYQCFASNSYGTAVSAKTMLRQAVLESFPTKTDPTRHRPLVGDYLKLSCVPPESYPKGGVYWGMDTGGQKFTAIEETARVSLDYDGHLHFSNVIEEDSLGRQEYLCIVQNPVLRSLVQGDDQIIEPRSLSAAATPKYHAPQLQWSSPTYTVALNSTVQHRMKCIFSGLPTPEVTWTSKTHDWDSARYELRSFGQEMIITRLQFSDAGTYTCAGSNKDGVSITREFRLIVESMPMWLEKPVDTTSAEEEDVEFHCRAGGVPKPELTWTVNGVPIEDLPPDSRRHVTPNTISYRNLTKADAQVLQCNASNKHGYKFENAFLNVRADPPSFIKAPQGVTKVAVDQEVTIHCQVYGAPKPRITWRYGNPPVEIQRSRRFHIMPNGDLVIKSVQETDEGAYQCLAENKFGKEHASGELIVREKTTITEFPQDQVVNASTDVVFHCNATTDGDEKEKLVYEWRRNGEAIDYTHEGRIDKNMNDHSLRITKATVDDTGHYTCVASNGIDSDESTAQLTVRDRPSRPRDLKLNSCTAQNAQVQWVPGSENHDIVREYIVFYNTSFDASGVFHVGNTVGRGTNMTRVTLSPWANYTFHVKARNSLGLSDPSEFTGVCTTEQMIPYNHPKEPCTESERPDQLVITWQPMPKIEHNGEGFRYVVKYRRNDIPGAEDVVRELTDWEQSRLVVDNVPTYRAYVISIQAKNDKGFAPSNKLKTLLGHSGDDTPLDSPRNFGVLNDTINATHALFEWNAVEDDPDRIRGHFVGYRVMFWKADNKEDKRSVELIKNPVEHCPAYPGRHRRRGGDQGEKETVHTNELWPYSQLQAAVLVLNSGQTGPLSDVISFSTPEGVPGMLAAFRVAERGSHHLKVEWSPPLEPNGILLGYRLTYKEVGGRVKQQDVTGPTRLQYKLHDLKPLTNYIIYIMGMTSKGTGQRSKLTDTTLEAGTPDVPHFTGFEYGDTFVNASFEPSEGERKNPGSQFYVEYKKAGDDDWQSTEPPERQHNWINVTDLEPGAQYEVRLVSMNGQGDESRSPSQTITIGPREVLPTPEPIKSNMATTGWFIGLMCALIFLILVLLIICLIRKNRGGKYPVHEKEKLAGHDPEKEDADAGFGEYTKTPYIPLRDSDEPEKKRSRTSLNSEEKPLESDTDSMAEYYETDPSKFNEDGSFIGQYGGKKSAPNDTTSPSALSTFV